jgi:tRNA A37 threonylcarbamoyladenosine dehydratase
MRDRILSINPNANITISKEFYLSNDDSHILNNNISYIVDAVDTVTAKVDLALTAHKLNIPIISSMGTGNKLNPTLLEVADIYQTSVCPLAKVMRKELKNAGLPNLKVVYSKEEPINITATPDEIRPSVGVDDPVRPNNTKKSIPGSVSFVPSVAGMIIASEVVKDLLG